ncbi:MULTISPECIES: DUF6130 family protein [Aneurinibacillus]|jgi:hypothetical protein|uniref:DUF4399 domain-containing protein n=1 Tax=Aneurinibacillus danicus TaxID=267746 RepID=A0A511V7C6_9BACL|nr:MULTISPECIES: DUF6130 family protein [Aneurinibacillus]GEN34866.1 hypothetical protein ADA01nite_23260 [Aneurinibacillus danicus]
MKKAFGYALILLAATGLTGCQEQEPLPDETAKSQEVLAQSPALAVSHSIEGNTVYLTFLTRNFMYAPAGEPQMKPGEGHVHVWVDNKLTRVYANTFKVSNLKPGPHTFSVELVRNNHKPYANTKITFTIQIK